MNDDELLAELREAVTAADPPPPSLREAAVRALTWDTELQELVVDLADLTFDSDLAASGMRSAVLDVHDLVFERGDVVVELTVAPGTDGAVVLTGSVTGREVTQVLVRQPGRRELQVDVDELGRFGTEVTGLVASVRVPGDPELRTPTFSLAP